MKCPECGGDTKVVNSRVRVDEVYRERACKVCGYRFRTTEIDEDMYDHMAAMAGQSTWERAVLALADRCTAQERCETCPVQHMCKHVVDVQGFCQDMMDELGRRKK